MTCKCAAWLSHAENICGATYPRFQNMKSVHALPDNVLKTERPGRNKSYVPLCNRRCSVPTASVRTAARKKTERRKNTEKKPAWLFPTFSGENCHNRLIFETEGARLRRIKNSRSVDIFPVWKDTPKCTPNFWGTSMLLAGLCGTMI